MLLLFLLVLHMVVQEPRWDIGPPGTSAGAKSVSNQLLDSGPGQSSVELPAPSFPEFVSIQLSFPLETRYSDVPLKRVGKTDTVLLAVLPVLPVILYLVYSYFRDIYSFWEKRGIVAKPATFPFGSSAAYTRESIFQGHAQQTIYNEFKGKPLLGFYVGTIPFLMVRDPEYVKLVLAKEFSHFRDRQGLKIYDDDHLSQHLFNLEGEKWRALRVKMSPVFTSGKLRGMFPLFIKCAAAFDNLIQKHLEKDLDIKDSSARFSTDIICSCAFGWEVNSLEDSETTFRKIGKKIFEFNFSYIDMIRIASMKYLPWMNDTPPPRLTPKETETFMIDAVKSTAEDRIKTGAKRNDFIDLLLQIKDRGILNEEISNDEEFKKNVEPIELTYELMTAQCFVFFLAGFETSSSVQTFCLHELSLHPEIQDRLHEEIEAVLAKHGGELTYKAVQEMEYLDMVISETMRKYPTLTMLTRRCVLPYVFPDGTRVEKGDRMLIPTWSLHRDPTLFSEPDRFDPERFSKENRDSIHPYAYLPFGEGPRICIGSRFGLLQSKMGVLTMIRKYKVSPAEEMKGDLEFDAKSPVLTRTKGPIKLRITLRN